MKKILLSIITCAALVSLSACGGDDNETVTVNGCASVANFSVQQQSDKLAVNITPTATALYYEISLQQAGQGDNPENGYHTTLDTSTENVSLDNIGGQSGNFVVFARAV